MAHRLTQRARSDLDDIWRYLAIESGNEAIADLQIDQLTDRFYMIANSPRIGRSAHAHPHRSDTGRGKKIPTLHANVAAVIKNEIDVAIRFEDLANHVGRARRVNIISMGWTSSFARLDEDRQRFKAKLGRIVAGKIVTQLHSGGYSPRA